MGTLERGPAPTPGEDARRRVQARPPEDTLRWLIEGVAPGGEVTDVAVMKGGSTAAMHRITVRSTDGAERFVALRRYVLEDILRETPDIAIHEAHAIQVVAPLGLPTPELLAHDPSGHNTDSPALVLSWLDGRPAWETLTRHQLDTMVEALLVLHSASGETRAGLRALERYEQTVYEPPRWTTHPGLWERAFEIFHGPIPTGDLALVHRDFHPGNLLWTRRRLTGIVGWQAACVGPASIDVGHCRLNMFHYSADQADQLRNAWERASGHAYDPWADVVSIIGILDTFRTHRRASTSLARIEHALAVAVANLTG